jgi:eukaryotic translation initiation factor 2C
MEGHREDKPNVIEVSVRNKGTLCIRKLVEHLTLGNSGITSKDPDIVECFRFLNAVYRKDPASKWMTRPKSSAFYTRGAGLSQIIQSTGGILEAVRGIFQSVSFQFGHLCLNVDTSCTAFYVPDLNFATKILAAYTNCRDVSTLNNSPATVESSERMIGMFFITKHTKNIKKMRVTGIELKNARELTFDVEDPITGKATTTTIEEYFRSKYSRVLEYPQLPLIRSAQGMFPMELCFTPSGERYKEVLQGEETADFIKFATSPCDVRAKQIMGNIQRLNWHNLEIPKQLGLSVKPKMLELSAKRLPTPTPQYRGASTNPENGMWNLRGKRFSRPTEFSAAWAVMYFAAVHGCGDAELQHFCKEIQTQFRAYGIDPCSAMPGFLRVNPMGDIGEAINTLVEKTKKAFGKKPKVIFFLIHKGANPGIYKSAKSVCNIELGICSQFMLVEKSIKNLRGQPQSLGNIALKINPKLGGLNSSVTEPLFTQKRWMMLGGDTSHPSAGELRKIPPPPSFCALVGSYDSACAMYTAVTTAQPATAELIETFGPMAETLLQRYKIRNNIYPDAIIYLRDGVSDSQIQTLQDTEVASLKEIRNRLKLRFTLTVINCVKRHHTRLFPVNYRGDKLGNVFPGTVVENGKTSLDIFLVSQSALQGTVRPCHYTVLYDENSISMDDFQRIIHGATYSYARATRSVSIHPAVYYADQVAEKAKMHLRVRNGTTTLVDVHEDLKMTMWWL